MSKDFEPKGISRRDALKIIGGTLAAAVTGTLFAEAANPPTASAQNPVGTETVGCSVFESGEYVDPNTGRKYVTQLASMQTPEMGSGTMPILTDQSIKDPGKLAIYKQENTLFVKRDPQTGGEIWNSRDVVVNASEVEGKGYMNCSATILPTGNFLPNFRPGG